MRARAAQTPIIDLDEARRFDLSSRTLRIVLVISGVQWPFLAALVAIFTDLSWVVAAVVAIAGALYTLACVRYFARLWRARLVNFTDPLSGRPHIPRPLPVSPALRHASVAMATSEIIAVAWLLGSNR